VLVLFWEIKERVGERKGQKKNGNTICGKKEELITEQKLLRDPKQKQSGGVS